MQGLGLQKDNTCTALSILLRMTYVLILEEASLFLPSARVHYSIVTLQWHLFTTKLTLYRNHTLALSVLKKTHFLKILVILTLS